MAEGRLAPLAEIRPTIADLVRFLHQQNSGSKSRSELGWLGDFLGKKYRLSAIELKPTCVYLVARLTRENDSTSVVLQETVEIIIDNDLDKFFVNDINNPTAAEAIEIARRITEEAA